MRRTRLISALVVIGLGICGSPNLEAQTPTRTLDLEEEFPEGFSYIAGIREMPDGSILLSDGLTKELLLVDMERGTAEMIGKQGAGPKEYDGPDALFALPGDSTLLVDLGNSRLTVLGPDLSFGETMPITQTADGQMLTVLPRGVDESGGLFFQPFGFGMRRRGSDGTPQLPDSSVIARYDRATGRVDTLGMSKLEERKIEGGGGQFRMTQVPMSPRDAWAVGANGQVVAARTDSYYLEWLGVDGTSAKGAPVEYTPVRIRTAEKQEWLDTRGRGGLNISMSMGANGARSMAFGRGGGGGQRDESINDYEFPEVMPAFHMTRALTPSPDGGVWVRRNVPSGGGAVYDVFDKNGNRMESITFPAGREVIGFGKGTVYTITYDEFDLQWLERYSL